MNPRDASFDDLVARIDEGGPIDWDAELRQAATPDDRQLVEALHTLADVAAHLREPERAARAAPAPAGTPWGELTVFEAVGRGAFGTVHRAVDSLKRTVALKVLDSGVDVAALKARILEEGQLLARVPHPNIVVVHGAGESDGRVGLWMEYVDGSTLHAEVDANGPMSAEEAALIGRKLCGALVVIHREGYVHADVKAQNVMRARGGRVVLMDFGAGQPLADGGSARLGGTPLYLSPERLAGAPPTTSCDIYALGVLLYYLVTGAYPIDAETREDVERAQRTGTRTRLRDRRSDLPDTFVAAVEDAIAPDPARRHPTAGAFDAALARVVTAEATASSAVTAAIEPVRPAPAPPAAPTDDHAAPPAAKPGRGWLVLAIAAGIVAASAFGLWRLGSGPTAVAPPVASRPVAIPAAAGDYKVQAGFYQVSTSGRRATAQGARIGRGDAIELDIHLTRDAHVYVLNEDERGSASLLFPLDGLNQRNPLRGGQTYTLPGPRGTEPVQWQVSSDGGREHFYVIVMPDPDPVVRAAIDRLTPASDHPESLNARAEPRTGGLRGVSKLAHVRRPAAAAEAPWRALARPLVASEETGRGMWVRQLTLENPANSR